MNDPYTDILGSGYEGCDLIEYLESELVASKVAINLLIGCCPIDMQKFARILEENEAELHDSRRSQKDSLLNRGRRLSKRLK